MIPMMYYKISVYEDRTCGADINSGLFKDTLPLIQPYNLASRFLNRAFALCCHLKKCPWMHNY